VDSTARRRKHNPKGKQNSECLTGSVIKTSQQAAIFPEVKNCIWKIDECILSLISGMLSAISVTPVTGWRYERSGQGQLGLVQS
jgi:hypothetical protein